MSKRIIGVVIAVVLAVTIAGCQESQETAPPTFSDMQIGSAFDPQTVFPASANYDFIRVNPDQEGLTPEAAAIVNRVRDALTNELKARGYRRVESVDKIDYLVDYELVAQQNVTVLTERTHSADGNWITLVGVPDNFIEGALVVDVIDFNNLRTVWRGVCHVNIATLEVSEAEKAQRVRYAVNKLLTTFPPR